MQPDRPDLRLALIGFVAGAASFALMYLLLRSTNPVPDTMTVVFPDNTVIGVRMEMTTTEKTSDSGPVPDPVHPVPMAKDKIRGNVGQNLSANCLVPAAGITGIGGVTVGATDIFGNNVASAVTAADGSYTIELRANLSPAINAHKLLVAVDQALSAAALGNLKYACDHDLADLTEQSAVVTIPGLTHPVDIGDVNFGYKP
jgi:hypothetical protein